MKRHPVSRVELPANCRVCFARHDEAEHGERVQVGGVVLTVDEFLLRADDVFFGNEAS